MFNLANHDQMTAGFGGLLMIYIDMWWVGVRLVVATAKLNDRVYDGYDIHKYMHIMGQYLTTRPSYATDSSNNIRSPPLV